MKRGWRRLKIEELELRIVFASDALSDIQSYNIFETQGLANSTNGVWELRQSIPARQGSVSYLQPSAYTAAVLDISALTALLQTAPMEFGDEASIAPLLISLPTPDNGFAKFAIVQSPIMEPDLAAQFPEIVTYSGQGIDDPAATLRFDVTPAGFHAQVLSPNGAYYIDPYWHLDQSVYVSYYKSDLVPRTDMEFVEELFDENNNLVKLIEADHIGQNLKFKVPLPENPKTCSCGHCLVCGESHVTRLPYDSGSTGGDEVVESTEPGPGSGVFARSGAQLRTYRLANAATGEYTAFHGGTVALGQAAIVTAINRVTGIYEKELSVRLVLVANNSLLVYTNAATDPYTNGNPSSLLSQNQFNIDSVIGSANYDIGHVFSTGGGGLAGLGVVGVNGQKARGETGLGSPIGDPFYVDYVAHEMGHQFGGNHTFNGVTGNCSGGNRNGSTAYEPGSGSTIQAYAGICGADNIQPASDPYFHSVSFDEISRYTTTGVGNSSASITITGNSIPRVNAGPDFAIPARTPFALSAAGQDADFEDALSYNWEQRDLGAGQTVAAADNGLSPIFRSFNPTASPERVLPRLAELLNNTTTTGEKLPTTNRTLRFRATVRDNRSGGGGLNTDDMQISVVNTGTPFAVTSPNTTVAWTGNETQSVTWNVAGTTAAPINTSSVNVWLSTNGGLSFSILLAADTPNDGSVDVVVPDLTTTTARIKVEATNSIYFDVSNSNFAINGSANTPPTVSEITNRLIDANSSTGAISFLIGDLQTPLNELVVAATSTNPVLLPNSGIEIAGTGANRSIKLTPAFGQFGRTAVSVSVTDASGLQVQETFQLFVEGSATDAGAVFYNDSGFETAGTVSDAIDTSKVLLRSGPTAQTTGFANVSNYTRGINGVVIDVVGLTNTLTAADFTFRVAPPGATDVVDPSTWAAAPVPTAIDTTAGTTTTAGRVRLEWADNAIQNTWLQIIVKANANTGLVSPAVYYLGSALGDTNGAVGAGSAYRTGTPDLSAVQSAINSSLVSVNNVLDVDKSRRVGTTDLSFVQSRVSSAVLLFNIVIPAAGSAAEGSASGGGRGVAGKSLGGKVSGTLGGRPDSSTPPIVVLTGVDVLPGPERNTRRTEKTELLDAQVKRIPNGKIDFNNQEKSCLATPEIEKEIADEESNEIEALDAFFSKLERAL